MTGADTGWWLAGAMGCAALAAWLTGALVHLRLGRTARSGARRVLRVALPMPAERAESAIAAALLASGHYILSFTGRIEGALMAVILSPGAASGLPLARLFLRTDDAGEGRSRAQIRVDFAGLIARTRRATAIVLFVVWPLWTVAVAASIGLAFIRLTDPNPWLVLHGFHATYPLLLMLVLLSRHDRRRRRIGDAVSAALRTVLHTGG